MILIAYIDMALGSMLLQALAGTVLAGMLMGRRIFAAPLEWIGFNRSAQDPDSESPEIVESATDR